MKIPQSEDFKPYSWQIKKKKSFLKHGDEIVAEFKFLRRRRGTFKLGDELYEIRNKGFWNPVTVLTKDRERIADLKRDFGGKRPTIETETGRYNLRLRNAVLTSLVIYDIKHHEVVRYRLLSKRKAIVKFVADEPSKEHLLIGIFGFFIFRGLILEQKEIEFSTITFNNKPGSANDYINLGEVDPAEAGLPI